MEIRKLIVAMAVSACVFATTPAGAVGMKPAVVQPSTTSKATSAKPVYVKVDAPSPSSQPSYEVAKSTWGAPPSANYYGLPTSDAQRKFK